MKKDINFPVVKDVVVTAVSLDGEWKIFLINRGERKLQNILISSKGYGDKDGKAQETSVLRHMIPNLEPGEYALVEPISEEVFHLTNEYWVSFFLDDQVFDKKYIFVPDTLVAENLSFIPELNLKGVLHE